MQQATQDVTLDPVAKIRCVRCGRQTDLEGAVPLSSIACPGCGAVLTVPGRIGQFVVVRRLGAGAMGTVFEALDEQLGRRVAIKVIRPDASDASDRKQVLHEFLAEARALAAVNHPNVVQVHSIGTHHDQPYIIMELVSGKQRLENMLSRREPIDEQRLLRLAIDVAQGLSTAARINLVHGDIKPQNILLNDEGVAKVVDFGLVGPAGKTGETVRGTPYYIAPERAQGKAVDHRADMFSLGATLYHLLAAAPPFNGKNVMEVVLARLRKSAPDIRTIRPDISAATAEILMRTMATLPADRYDTYADLIAELQSALDFVEQAPEPGLADLLAASAGRNPLPQAPVETPPQPQTFSPQPPVPTPPAARTPAPRPGRPESPPPASPKVAPPTPRPESPTPVIAAKAKSSSALPAAKSSNSLPAAKSSRDLPSARPAAPPTPPPAPTTPATAKPPANVPQISTIPPVIPAAEIELLAASKSSVIPAEAKSSSALQAAAQSGPVPGASRSFVKKSKSRGSSKGMSSSKLLVSQNASGSEAAKRREVIILGTLSFILASASLSGYFLARYYLIPPPTPAVAAVPINVIDERFGGPVLPNDIYIEGDGKFNNLGQYIIHPLRGQQFKFFRELPKDKPNFALMLAMRPIIWDLNLDQAIDMSFTDESGKEMLLLRWRKNKIDRPTLTVTSHSGSTTQDMPTYRPDGLSAKIVYLTNTRTFRVSYGIGDAQPVTPHPMDLVSFPEKTPAPARVTVTVTRSNEPGEKNTEEFIVGLDRMAIGPPNLNPSRLP